jgi:hypothetical protein
MADLIDSQVVATRAALVADIRALFLDRLAKIVQAAGMSSVAGVDALRSGAGRYFDDMSSERPGAGFVLADDITASQIMLVDDKQLEFSIRMGELSRRVGEACSASLQKLHRRLVTLLARPSLRTADSPVSPEGVCKGLAEMFGAVGDFQQQSLALLVAIETGLIQDLPVFYAELNERLARHQIAPSKMQVLPSDDRARDKRHGLSGGAQDPVASLQQAMLARREPAGQRVAGAAGGVTGDTAGGSAGEARELGAATAAMGAAVFERVLGQLGQWQQQAQAELFGGAAEVAAENVLHALKSGDFASALRVQEAAALDVLAALFDALFDDPRLSNAVKAAIARLQIPMLKVAMLDASFFSERNHPARMLLDAMGEAAIGLGPDVDGGHPVCAELRRVAVAVQAEFDRDTEVFSRHAAELETFIARRGHVLQAGAQGFISLAKTQEERDLAAIEACRLVCRQTMVAVPPVIADFLLGDWTDVLADAWLAGGETGEGWREAGSVVEDLLWSVQPKSDPEERKRLAVLLPSLLRRLRTGLDRIGVTPQARGPFLDACLELQTAALRGSQSSTQVAPVVGASAVVAAGDTVRVLAMDGLTLKSVRPANPETKVAGERVRDLVTGDWVEFQLPDGAACGGRLCWISPMLASPLFTNPDWDYAISIAGSILERQLASGRAIVGSGQSLFGNAAEKVLSRDVAVTGAGS